MLQAQALTVRHGAITALHGVSLTVTPGALSVVLGLNGAGKSSLIHALSGLMRPDAGTVTQDGADVTHLPLHRREAIALVPEGRSLAARLTVAETLRLGAGRLPARIARTRAADLLDQFPELARRHDQPCAALSGGEATLMALARALMAAPRYLLLDEPTLGLSPAATKRVHQTLADLRRQGLGLLLVDQNLHTARAMADTVTVLQGGRVALQAPAHSAPQGAALESLLFSQGVTTC